MERSNCLMDGLVGLKTNASVCRAGRDNWGSTSPS